MWGYGGFWGFPWFGLFFGIFFLAIVLFCLLRGRRYWHHWDRRDYQNSAEDILAEKYAKGELTEKGYQEKLDVLRKHSR